MNYTTIPRTDLNVSRICLGSTHLATKVLPLKESFALLSEFVSLGGNFLDTAHVYSNWIPGTRNRSEKALGAWFKESGLRDRVILATKGAHPELDTMNVSRLSAADITRDIDESLQCLQVDTIDLYWLHRDDPKIPISAIVDTLNQQVKAGKIRYFGCSNWTAPRIQEALDYSASHNVPGFVANQPLWNLGIVNVDQMGDQTLVVMDAEAIGLHKRSGLAAIPYTSQAQGFFTKLDAANGDSAALSDELRRVYFNEANIGRFQRAKALAKQYGVPLNDVVLAYLLSQPFVTIPVVGCKNLDHLHASLHAINLTLTPHDLDFLEGAA